MNAGVHKNVVSDAVVIRQYRHLFKSKTAERLRDRLRELIHVNVLGFHAELPRNLTSTVF